MKKTALARATHLAVAAMACSTLALVCAPAFAQDAGNVQAEVGNSNHPNATSPQRKQTEDTQTTTADAKPQQTNNGKAKSDTSSTQNATNLGTVTVTAQLSALQRAESVKRNAIGIVDSISAEGVGKFPDADVADALKRVPGVAVDNGGGEAQKITVRGFGPDFVNVLINGRTAASYSRYRAFNFDILPSEMIASARVKKTSTASTEGGGIGGTVNIITRRPLDYHGFHIHAKLEGVYDHTSGGPDTNTPVTPKAALTLSDTNGAGTFGWMVSGVYYKRDHVEQEVETHGWESQDFSDLNPSYTDVFLPHEMEVNVNEEDSIHRAVFGSVQWRPSDNFTARLDTLYSHYNEMSKSLRMEVKPKASHIESITADANGTAIAWTGRKLRNRYKIETAPDINATEEQTGLNLNYQINESLNLTFDASTSKAWRKQPDHGYSMELESSDHHEDIAWTNDKAGFFPSITGLHSPTDLSGLRAGYFEIGDNGGLNNNVSDKVSEYELNLSKSFAQGALSELSFGLQYKNQRKRQALWELPADVVSALYSGVDVPADAVNARVFNAGSVVNDISPDFPHKWVQYDPGKLLAYLNSSEAFAQHDDPAADAAIVAANGGLVPRVQPSTVSDVDEKVRAAFVEANFTGAIGDHFWLLNAGVRYTRTKTTATALGTPLVSLVPNPHGADFPLVATFGPMQPISKHNSYAQWLPSATFKLHLRDNVIFRVAASKTIARPTLSSLVASSSYVFTPDVQGVTTGNVDLKPYISKNADMSIEWYINRFSYMSLDVFEKHVKNFTTLITVPTTILGYRFLHTLPVNLNKAVVKGAEATIQYQFQHLPSPFDGLGVAANYTYVTSNSSLHQGKGGVNGEFTIPGIGDTYNVSLYYDKGPIQARVAYNWRGSYLVAVAGDEGQPTMADPFGQLDFSASYRFSKHFSVFFNAINLTDQTFFHYQIYRNRANKAQKNGRRFMLGVHASW